MDTRVALKPFWSLLLASALGTVFIPATAAASPTPRIGNCYNLTDAQIDSDAAPAIAPVNCKRTHNAETYRIGTWPYKTYPSDLDSTDAIDIAETVCSNWEALGVSDESFFNFWAWYTPDRASWKKGARWIRCDAMVTINDQEPYVFKKWQKKKLDLR